MIRLLKLIIILEIIIFSNGCGTLPPIVRSHVTSFHNISGPIENNTFKVLPYEKSMEGSLQFQNYAKTISSFLERSGFRLAEESHEADYTVFVSFGISSGKTITESTPIFGQTGGGTTSHSGSVYNAAGSTFYSGTSYTMPTYGVVGSSTSTRTQYTRNLALDIVNTSSLKSAKPQKIYEGRVKSTGKCGDVNIVMSEMIQSLFTQFPGKSGQSVTIDIDQPESEYNNC